MNVNNPYGAKSATAIAHDILTMVMEREAALTEKDQIIDQYDRKYNSLVETLAQKNLGAVCRQIAVLEEELSRYRGVAPPRPPSPRGLVKQAASSQRSPHAIGMGSNIPASALPVKGQTCKGCGAFVPTDDSVHQGFIPWKEHHKVCPAPPRTCQGCGVEVMGSFTDHNKICPRSLLPMRKVPRAGAEKRSRSPQLMTATY